MKKIITQLDLGATSNPLYINQTTSINSFYCGVVSIIGLVFLAFYIMNKFSVLSNTINYQNYEVKNNPTFSLDEF